MKDIFDKARRWFKDAQKSSSEWRTEAEEDYAFLAGHQWSDEDKATLQDQMRPVITFNRISPIIESVCGLEVNNRRETKFLPRNMGAVGVNEMLTAANKWARDNCDAEDEESEAFADLVTCGMGWTLTRMDYDSSSEGDIVIERIDPLEMYWDMSAKKKNLADAQYVMRVRDISKESAEEMFPDADEDDLDADWAGQRTPDSPHDQTQAPFYTKDGGADREEGTVRIVQLQWWEREEVYVVTDPETGKRVDLSRKKYDALTEAIGDVPYVKVRRKKFFQAFIGKKVLDEGPLDCGHFTLKCLTGKRDRNKNTYYGLVRAMKDPQRWANKWLSQTLHIINTNAKGGVMVEKDAVPNIRQFEETWADPSGLTVVSSGALSNGKIKEKPQVNFPSGMDSLMQFAVASIRDTSGVNLELLGASDREQAGVLEFQRKQAALTVLAGLFDSLKRYRREQGRVMLYFIREYISDGRLIRIDGENAQFVPLVRDQDTATYDVVVDDSPTAPNQKERAFAVLSNLLPMLIPAGVPIPPEIVDFAPLPVSVTQKWKQMLMQPKGASAEEVVVMQQAIQKLQEENAQLKARNADKTEKNAMTEKEQAFRRFFDMYNAEEERKVELQKIGVQQADSVMDAKIRQADVLTKAVQIAQSGVGDARSS